jgi:glycosyltransferase involved in cell wall biosynthesis
MQPIKICHLTSAHPVYDTRIFFKECVSMAAAGFVTSLIVAGSHDHERDGVKIINAGPRRASRPGRMLLSAWNIYKAAKKLNADIYHFHDPELLPYGWLLKRSGKKIVYDVHEDVGADILDKEWVSGWLRKPVASLFVSFQNLVTRKFDGIAAVTEEIAGKFNHVKRIILLRNFPVIGKIDAIVAAGRADKDKFVVVYAGMLTRTRGMLQLVEAMQYVPSHVELRLYGSWENEALEKQCATHPGHEKVKYMGNVSQEASIAAMKVADAGVVNFLPIANHVTALPNKPFEYMACSLPIIMSDFPSWRTLFDGCAVFVNPLNSKDIASKMLLLINDREYAQATGRRGAELARDHYSWEAESNKLVKLYKEIMNG